MKLFKVLSLVLIGSCFCNPGPVYAAGGDEPKAEVAINPEEQPSYTANELYSLCMNDPQRIASDAALQELVADALVNEKLWLSGLQVSKVIPDLVAKAYNSYLLRRVLMEQTDEVAIPEGLVNTIRKQATAAVVDTEAQFIYAQMLITGRGVECDSAAGRVLLESLAERDMAVAQYSLWMHFVPPGGIMWLSKVARQGLACAEALFGWHLKYGLPNADRTRQAPDPDKAVEFLSRAAKCGHCWAQYDLGGMYIEGWQKEDGTWQSPDLDMAIELWFESTTRGMVIQQNYLYSGARSTMLELDRKLCAASTVESKLKDSTDKSLTEETLMYLQLGQGKFSDNGFGGAEKVPAVGARFQQVSEDLDNFRQLVGYLNKPGFLVTCLQPKKIELLTAAPEEPMLSYFKVQGENYLCFGRDNVKAARKLLPLLEKMHDGSSLGFLRGYFLGHKPQLSETSPQTVNVIRKDGDNGQKELQPPTDFAKELRKMRDQFRKISDEVYEAITIQAGNRNKRLLDTTPGWPEAE